MPQTLEEEHDSTYHAFTKGEVEILWRVMKTLRDYNAVLSNHRVKLRHSIPCSLLCRAGRQHYRHIEGKDPSLFPVAPSDIISNLSHTRLVTQHKRDTGFKNNLSRYNFQT